MIAHEPSVFCCCPGQPGRVRRARLLAVLCLTACLPAAAAENTAQPASAGTSAARTGKDKRSAAEIRRSLALLERRIGRLQRQLEQKRSAASKTLAELALIEKEAAALLTRISRNLKRIGTLERKLEAVRVQRDRAERRLVRLREDMLRMAKAVFSFGQSVSLRIWLSEHSPGEVQRALAYHRYIEAGRARNIRHVLAQLNRLARLRRDYDRRKAVLEQERDRHTRQLQAYQDKRTQRNRVVSLLRQQLQTGRQSLNRLQSRRAELSEVLKFLQQQRRLSHRPAGKQQRPVSDARGRPAEPRVFVIAPGLRGKPFGGLKGRLPWPIQGNVISYFNRRNTYGKLHAKGVLIAAPSGTAVKSIARGTVVFANWLRGYGMIMIIDHGNQYLTMYGHNRRLLKRVGEPVEAGEKIAEVGDTGGLKRTALYFEIRRRGRPLNPLEWVRVASGRR